MQDKTDVGVIGLGIMGSAMAGNFLRAGLTVAGHDPDPLAVRSFTEKGGLPLPGAADVAASAAFVFLSLPSPEALKIVTADIAANAPPERIIIETSTLAIEDKMNARDVLEQSGMTLLDCPLSGTGAQAAAGDLVILASGDKQSVEECAHVFAAMSRQTCYLGAFGNGMKMKFIANHLVAIHNAAAAEALVLAHRAGLDLQQTYEVISAGAGTSRMFDIRGPMMVEGRYDPPTMKNDVWRKDLDLISGFAEVLGAPVPLFSTTDRLYAEAEALGLGGEDTAAVKRVFEAMAGKEASS